MDTHTVNLNLAAEPAQDSDSRQAQIVERPVVTTPPPITNREMVRYVAEANLLLAYSAKTGLDVNANLIACVVNTHHAVLRDELKPEQEIEFWQAFNQLAKLVHPVSVASLKATNLFKEEAALPEKKYSLFGRTVPSSLEGDSLAKRTVSLYQRWTLIILFGLLFTQVYWLLGSMRVAPVVESTMHIKEIAAQLEIEKERVSPDEWSANRAINLLESKLRDTQMRLIANYEVLQSWGLLPIPIDFTTPTTNNRALIATDAVNVATVMQQPETSGTPNFYPFSPAVNTTASSYTPERAMQVEIMLQEKQFVLRAIQLYLLPLLYGLLGASAYVLRTLTVEIRSLTYVNESNVSYRLRIQLGALSGLAIGWFISPDAISFSALSPLALAFLAGYSVEVLFAAMDRLIYTFSNDDMRKMTSDKVRNV